jgi:hypothetical protein
MRTLDEISRNGEALSGRAVGTRGSPRSARHPDVWHPVANRIEPKDSIAGLLHCVWSLQVPLPRFPGNSLRHWLSW